MYFGNKITTSTLPLPMGYSSRDKNSRLTELHDHLILSYFNSRDHDGLTSDYPL